MILRIDHAALSVPDIEKALAFYCGVMGFTVDFQAGWPSGVGQKPVDQVIGVPDSEAKVAMIRLGDTRIELFEFAAPVPDAQDPARSVHHHGITHLCFAVADVPAEHARLSAAGVTFNSPPLDLGGGFCAYGRDPFGNVFELIQASE